MTSAIWYSTVLVGFRLVMGSWKIMETTLPRIDSICFSERVLISSPWTLTVPFTKPGGEGISRRIDKPVVVLPAPVSPTRPMVSPLASLKLTPLRACTTSLST